MKLFIYTSINQECPPYDILFFLADSDLGKSGNIALDIKYIIHKGELFTQIEIHFKAEWLKFTRLQIYELYIKMKKKIEYIDDEFIIYTYPNFLGEVKKYGPEDFISREA